VRDREKERERERGKEKRESINIVREKGQCRQ
jgi:hypothetical protein